jgi:hypothetical protein
LHGAYLFAAFTRRIVAPFGHAEMRRFIVCCLFAPKTSRKPANSGVGAAARFAADAAGARPW